MSDVDLIKLAVSYIIEHIPDVERGMDVAIDEYQLRCLEADLYGVVRPERNSCE